MSSRTKIRLAALGIFIFSAAAAVFDLPRFTSQWGLPAWFRVPFRLGLDLKGGVQLIYVADVKNVPPGDEASALSGVRDVIERRVDVFGVSEAVVQTARSGNDWRVIVELPGVTDVAAAVKMIDATPLLEFKELNPNPATSTPAIDVAAVKAKAEKILQAAVKPQADFATLARENSEDASAQAGGDLGWVKAGQFVPEFETVCFTEGKVGAVYPQLAQSQFGYHIIKVLERRGAGAEQEAHCSHILFLTVKPSTPLDPWINTGLTGAHLQRANVTFDPQSGTPEVTLQFDGEGAKLFGEITERNIDKQVAIFLDGEDISSPVVREVISSGSAVISGDFSIAEAKQLKERLNAGALPVPITIISQQGIGATLGQVAITKSLYATMVGLLLIVAYMLLVYRWPGLLASLALAVYGLLLIVIFKLIPVTMTLAGISGFILGLGMAVDANILIYERLKEELRVGNPLSRSIAVAFQRAWPSIRDGNYTTLLTSFILMWFSTSMVKGFAVTLSLGILVNLFTAMVVSRVLLECFQPRRHPERWLWWYGMPRTAIRAKTS